MLFRRAMILVGTSGWSYADWVGPVYPPAYAGREWARLPFYAQHFSTVEINSTFYRTPPPSTVNGWVRRARRLPTGLEFSVTLPGRKAGASRFNGSLIARPPRRLRPSPMQNIDRCVLVPPQYEPTLGATV
ncbi:MAG: DUF72 domain-containing protein, partial [Thermoplasmatota archaeon]